VPVAAGGGWRLGERADDVPGAGDATSAAEKGTLHAGERDTPRVRALRGQFRWQIAAVNPKKLVFVDESGVNTSMTRTRGRAAPGERVAGAVPQAHWTTLMMLGALGLDGVAAAATVDAATDTDVFDTFVRQVLVPALRAGDVVVWDNLSPHKAAQVEPELARARATLMCLPPYSPDFSPIKPCWSKVKRHMRDVEPRTPEALGRAAAEGFSSVTDDDARGWFEHCGCCVH